METPVAVAEVEMPKTDASVVAKVPVVLACSYRLAGRDYTATIVNERADGAVDLLYEYDHVIRAAYAVPRGGSEGQCCIRYDS